MFSAQNRAQITKLNDLLNAGAINWDTYGRAVRQAKEKLEAGGPKYQPPEFMRSGSAQAQEYQYKLKHNIENVSKSVEERQFKEQQQSNFYLQQLVRQGQSQPQSGGGVNLNVVHIP